MEKSGDLIAADRHLRIAHRSLHNEVADILRDLIIRGDLAPGTRIIEKTLCEQLNVSRTPLREALKVLESEELVEILPHRGALVCSFTPADARSLFEVIARLEGLAAELVARQIQPPQLRDLEHQHQRMRDYYERGSRDEYFALNSHIHQQLILWSENAVLQSTHARLLIRASRGRYMAIFDPKRWDQAVEEHEALMQALRVGSPEQAGRIWQTHLEHTGEAVCAALAESRSERTSTR